MSDERWRRVEELFFAAAELSEPARTEFLERACGNDPELLRETKSLLVTDTLPGDSISTLIESAASSLLESDSMEGTRLGAWRVIREIGRGGMGAVYLAARADDQFDKQVAIKLVKRGIDTDAVLKRFRQERRILAGLDHPGIARLIDGGTSPDGRPYFVMEYVAGTPIHQFCQQQSLSLAERCELFRKVCETVWFAHRNLVIHRDLKPANILVTADGSPKLLDFGIAKLLSVESGDHTVERAHRGGSTAALTPAYASPEQLRGEPVNTATDVYSLGTILAQILAGNPPGTHGRSSPFPPDLHRIVLMATHADPARRYQSVDLLSEDLRRYLTGRTVLAQDDSISYRFRKFVSRNRVSVLAGTLAAALLIGGIVTVLWEARQTSLQRQRAEERLGELVEMANQTLFRVDGSIERLPGATQARRNMVRSTLDYLDRLNTENGNDGRVLAAMASAYTHLARIEGNPLQPNLGDLRGSEESYRKAAKILTGLIAVSPEDTSIRLQMAECSKGLAEVLDISGKRDAAVGECRRGLLQTSHILDRDPHNLAARKSAALLHLTAVAANASANHVKEAHEEGLSQLEPNARLAAEYPQDADCILNLASTYSQLGGIAIREGHLSESMQDYRKSVALREQLIALHPNDVAVQRDLMIAYGHVGDTLGSPFVLSFGDPHGALVWYRKAAHIAETMVASDLSDTQARIDLGVVLMRIGTVLQAPGEVRESLETFDRSAAILSKVQSASPDNASSAAQLTLLYEYKARRLNATGDFTGAIANYRESFELCEAVLKKHPQPSCDRQLVVDEGGMAGVEAQLGHREQALRLSASALARAEAGVGPGSTIVAKAYLARALGWSGDTLRVLARQPLAARGRQLADLTEAAAMYRRALDQWSRLDPAMISFYARENADARKWLAECESRTAALNRDL